MRAWVVLLLLPLTAAEPGIDNPADATPVRLYPHLIGHMDMPINTQPPADDWAYTENLGLLTHSQGCVDVPGLGLVATTHHTFYGFAAPDLVDYDRDEPRHSPQRGIHTDIHLDTDAGIGFTWYLETEIAPSMTTAAPAPVPQAVVRATVREGDAISVDHAAMNQGTIIALGQTEPVTMLGPATPTHPHVQHTTSDGRDVYAFQVPMAYAAGAATIRSGDGFNLRVDIFLQLPGCDDPAGDRYVIPDWVRAHTSPGHRPTLDLAIAESVLIRSVTSQVVNGTLVVDARVDTPWGPYNLGDVSLRIDGPSPADGLRASFRDPEPFERPDSRLYRWAWDFGAAGAAPGDYTLNVSAIDAQGRGPAVARLPFSLGAETTTCRVDGGEPICTTAGGDQESPAPWPLGLLVALALLRRHGQ